MQGFSPNACAPNAFSTMPFGGVVVPPPDTTAPTFQGSLAHTKTSSSITIDWSGTTSRDDVAVARREYRIGGSGAYTAASAGEEVSKKHTFAGLASSAVYQIEMRCVDTSGNVSQPLAIVVTTSAPSSGGQSGTNYLRGTLATRKGMPQVSLAAVNWSLFLRRPGNMGAPVAEGTHTMTAGSAQFQIPVPAATVPSDWYFLVLSDGDGTTALAAPILVGP